VRQCSRPQVWSQSEDLVHRLPLSFPPHLQLKLATRSSRKHMAGIVAGAVDIAMAGAAVSAVGTPIAIVTGGVATASAIGIRTAAGATTKAS
jgi:hypothetical protein